VSAGFIERQTIVVDGGMQKRLIEDELKRIQAFRRGAHLRARA
jgi:hypothetical protein